MFANLQVLVKKREEKLNLNENLFVGGNKVKRKVQNLTLVVNKVNAQLNYSLNLKATQMTKKFKKIKGLKNKTKKKHIINTLHLNYQFFTNNTIIFCFFYRQDRRVVNVMIMIREKS